MSSAILFIPFDAFGKNPHVDRMAKKGVSGYDSEGGECVVEPAGIAMTKDKIKQHMADIVKSLVYRVWENIAAFNDDVIPELIFLSEEVAAGAFPSVIEFELERPTLQQTFCCSCTKSDNADLELKYMKLPNQAGTRPFQRIAAYALVYAVGKRRKRIREENNHAVDKYSQKGIDSATSAVVELWENVKTKAEQKVLIVTYTPRLNTYDAHGNMQVQLKIAGVHLTSSLCNAGPAYHQKAAEKLVEICKPKGIQIVLGDFNFDVGSVNVAGLEKAWRGSVKDLEVVVCDPDPQGQNFVRETETRSSSSDKKHYMGLMKMNTQGKIQFDATSLHRSLPGVGFFSDHSPVYVSLTW